MKRLPILYRSNGLLRISSLQPGRRVQIECQQRAFFGLGEIIGVITNPGEVIRSLAESRKLLEEARMEIQENKERAQLRPIHTFSPHPEFFMRGREIRAIEGALEGSPSFTILFGASSVGKTALLREVLSRHHYHVLFFDLRIAGFADLRSLYFSLVGQMEQYFGRLTTQPGWKDWEKESWRFKHDRLDVERRIADAHGFVQPADIARVMELFQSSLLKYWEFEPKLEGTENDKDEKSNADRNDSRSNKKMSEKKIPVLLFDEAHKLPALIQSTEAMKILLDAMLVFTKQDRLCHVIHATSDCFYQTWLRQLNVMQHCKIISIGDCSKQETQMFFFDRLLPNVPNGLQKPLSAMFEELYEAFGGKLAHWGDFVTDYVNAKGNLTVEQSSHFLQAHALLNLQLLHSRKASSDDDDQLQKQSKQDFQIYSAIPASPHAAPSPSTNTALDDDTVSVSFTTQDLLTVMNRLTSPDTPEYIPYFPLCKELGADSVDAMVRGRILELRWTRTVAEEEDKEDRDMDIVGPKLLPTTPILSHAMRTVIREWS